MSDAPPVKTPRVVDHPAFPRGIMKTRAVAFEAGEVGRRLRAIPTATKAINSQIRRYGKNVLARSRYLAANNPYASMARDTYVSSLVGTGIVPSPLLDDPELKATVRDIFEQWTDEADADWQTDWYGLQAQVASEMFEAGEVFARKRTRLPEDRLFIPFQVQLLPAEMLDTAYNIDLGNGRRIECGIQFDAIGRREGYHFWAVHPGSDILFGKSNLSRVFVPADEVLHIFKPVRSGQVRGLPHTLAAITTLALLDLYDDAELERKRTAALFSAFIKREGHEPDQSPFGNETQNPGDGRITSGASLEPGAVVELEPGEDVTFAAPADVGVTYDAFEYRNLLKAAAGFKVPYAGMTGDLRQANYGSIRAGLITFRRSITADQHGVMAFKFCLPIWRWFWDEAVLAQRIPISPSDYLKNKRQLIRAKWQPPAWEWIDPQKDVAAAKVAVDNNFRSRDSVIEETGEDPERVDDQIAAGRERLATRGLSPDPFSPQSSGNQPPQPDPNEGG